MKCMFFKSTKIQILLYNAPYFSKFDAIWFQLYVKEDLSDLSNKQKAGMLY
jgi:hypothetical protein